MVSWAALFDEAVRKPGYIHEAYSRFRFYRLGSQLLPLFGSALIRNKRLTTETQRH